MTNLRTWAFLGLGGISTVAIALYWQHWEFFIVVAGIGAIALVKVLAVSPLPAAPKPLSRHQLIKSLDQVNRLINKISDRPIQISLKTTAQQIATDLNQNQFRIVVFGISSSGKTSVINALGQNLEQNLVGVTAPASDTTRSQPYTYIDKLALGQLALGQSAVRRKISLVDTPSIQNRWGAIGLSQEAEATVQAESADLLLFVTSGDLGAIEYQALVSLAELGKRIILVFNKIDQYLPPDRELIEVELKLKTSKFLLATDVVAIAAHPAPITVRQYENCYSDQSPKLIKEWLEPLPPDVGALKARIESILSGEWEELLLLNTNHKLQQLQNTAQLSLQKIRHSHGHEIITRYQWINAGIIFVSPIPAIDLLANVALNAKLYRELSQIYDRQLSLKQAQKMAMAMVEIFIKLGCVEVATVAIASQVSYFLKTSAVTFALGGTVQAVSAAYFTHIGGVSFLDYLDQTPESDFSVDSMINICGANFAKMQDMSFVKDFVGRTIANLAVTS